MAEAEFRRGAGEPDQLPHGAASQLNEALEALPEQADDAMPEQAEEAPPAAVVETRPPRVRFRPQNDDEEFLFAAPEPDEVQLAGTAWVPGQPPERLRHLLPDLLEAAAEPTAPWQLRLLAQVLAERLGA